MVAFEETGGDDQDLPFPTVRMNPLGAREMYEYEEQGPVFSIHGL